MRVWLRSVITFAVVAVAILTLAPAASAVAIDGYRFDGPSRTCTDPFYTPGMRRLVAWMQENPAWTPTKSGTYCGGTGIHQDGRAVDWHLDVRDAAQRSRAEDLVYTLLAPDVEGNAHSLARRMGVQEIIWNDMAWDARLGDGGMVPYFQGQPGQTCFNVAPGTDLYRLMHCDHVHIGINWNGSNEATTFWNSLNTQRSDSTFLISDESSLTVSGPTVGRPIHGRPRDDRLGLPGDKPIVGDWDGNRSTTIGVVRGNQWHLRNSASTGRADLVFGYGMPTDTPIVGDWNGDRVQTPGIVRAEGGHLFWHLRNSNTEGAADISFKYGLPGDMPVVGDWDGDGDQTIGIVRAVNGYLQWHLRNSNTEGVGDISFTYGVAGDRPVAGDWNNDGRDTQGIARAAAANSWCSAGSMQWKLSDTLATGANRVYGYGCWNDRVVVGDWNNNGTDTVGVGRRF